MIYDYLFRSPKEYQKLINYFDYLSHLEEINKFYTQPKKFTLWHGDKIHITFKEGIYTVKSTSYNKVVITCKKWQIEKQRGQRLTDEMTIFYNEVKCMAGGRNNIKYK